MNKAKITTLIVAAFAVALAPMSGAHALTQEPADQRLIITFKDRLTEQDVSAVKGEGASTIKRLDLINGMVVTVPSQAVTNRLKNLHNVERVEADAIVYATAPPKSTTTTPVVQPAQSLPWGVSRIDAPKAWAASRGAGIQVAVIDTGIDKTHPDLVDNIAGGVNFVATGRGMKTTVDPTAWNDDNGHGTHVSGTIAAADNAIGVIGVAPQARLYGVKVLNSAGNGYTSDIISGIQWSVANQVQVISMSLGQSTPLQALQDAVDAADNAGIVVVVAAGNTGDGDAATNNVGYPARYASTIAVAATDNTDHIASFSSDGPEVEIAAPGVNILSTTRGGSYGTMSGTSMATPHVTGVVADMLAAPIPTAADLNLDGAWSKGEVRAYLQATADDLGTTGRDVFFGYGLIDAEELVTGIQTQ
jgi:subtilisin family serine protease